MVAAARVLVLEKIGKTGKKIFKKRIEYFLVLMYA